MRSRKTTTTTTEKNEVATHTHTHIVCVVFLLLFFPPFRTKHGEGGQYHKNTMATTVLAAATARETETVWSKEVSVPASASFPSGKIVLTEMPRRSSYFDHMLSVEGVMLEVIGRVIFLDVETDPTQVHKIDPATGKSHEQLRADFTVELFGLLQEEAAKALAAAKAVPTRIEAANFAGGRIGEYDRETLAARPEFLASQRECRAAAELAHKQIFALLYDEGFFSPEDTQMKTAWESARRPAWEKTIHAHDADRDDWAALPAARGLKGPKADAAFAQWAAEQPLLEDEAANAAFDEWANSTPPTSAESVSARGFFFRQSVKTLFYDGEMAADRITVKTASELRSRFKAGVPIWRKVFQDDKRTPVLVNGKPTFRHDPISVFSEVGPDGEQLEASAPVLYKPMDAFPVHKRDVIQFRMKPRVFHQPGGKWSLAFDIVRDLNICIGRRAVGNSADSSASLTPPLFFGRPPQPPPPPPRDTTQDAEESTRNIDDPPLRKFARIAPPPDLV